MCLIIQKPLTHVNEMAGHSRIAPKVVPVRQVIWFGCFINENTIHTVHGAKIPHQQKYNTLGVTFLSNPLMLKQVHVRVVAFVVFCSWIR